MTETSVSGTTTEDEPGIEQDNDELKRVIEARVVLGYQIESLTDTRAVLVVKGRKRMFGLRGGDEQRTEVTIDERGRAVTREL